MIKPKTILIISCIIFMSIFIISCESSSSDSSSSSSTTTTTTTTTPSAKVTTGLALPEKIDVLQTK